GHPRRRPARPVRRGRREHREGARRPPPRLRRLARRLDALEHGLAPRRAPPVGLGALRPRRPERVRPPALPAAGGDAHRVRPALRDLAGHRRGDTGAARADRRRGGGDRPPVPPGAVPPLPAGRTGADRRAAARRRRAPARPAVLEPTADRLREEPVISRRDAPQWVKEAGRAATRAGGRLTAGARMLPDFLMVGTQRGGTTSLFRALAEHPAIVQPNFHKGVHYFDVNYTRGMSWYRGHFPTRSRAERRVASAGFPEGTA